MNTREKAAELAARSKRLRKESREVVSHAKNLVRNSQELIKSVRRERARGKAAHSGK